LICAFHTVSKASNYVIPIANINSDVLQTVVIPGLLEFFILIFNFAHDNGPQRLRAKPHQTEHAQFFFAGLAEILIVKLAG